MAVEGVSSVVIAQGAAGTTTLVAAPGAGLEIVVHGADIAIDGGGSFKLVSGSTDITGSFYAHSSSHANVSIAQGADCVIKCGANEALKVTSVTNPVSGVLFYSVQSA